MTTKIQGIQPVKKSKKITKSPAIVVQTTDKDFRINYFSPKKAILPLKKEREAERLRIPDEITVPIFRNVYVEKIPTPFPYYQAVTTALILAAIIAYALTN